jgi:UDPglucose 6-dehydrogenase
MTTAPTGFVGLSHLGVVSSIGWASFGKPVTAVDLDRAPVEALRRGALPVHEPNLQTLFVSARGRITFSTDPAELAACPLVVFARDVPTDAGNASDPSAVLALVDAATGHLKAGVTLVLMSQVPPGFTRRLGERIRSRRPDLDFQLYYWVETLVFGNAVERFLRPERIVLGCADATDPLPLELEAALRHFGCPVLRMAYESAELTKTAINLYLCGAVTYANVLSDLCEAIGANWWEMVPALRMDSRIGPAAYIRPGLGIGGGNLERDMITLRQLCRAHGVDGAYLDTLIDYNARRYRWVHEKLERHVLAGIPDPVIAVWGLAYKKNTRSTKNSMALRVIADLGERAQVRAYDPVVRAADVNLAVEIVEAPDDALIGADGLLILTDWEEFAAPRSEALRSMRRPVVIDCVGVVNPHRLDLSGIEYVSMGRPLGHATHRAVEGPVRP